MNIFWRRPLLSPILSFGTLSDEWPATNAYPLDCRFVGQVGGALANQPHLGAGDQQEGTEYIEDEQAFLECKRCGEVAEQDQLDEDLVDGLRLLDQIDCDVFQCFLVGLFTPGRAVEVASQGASKEEGYADPGTWPGGRFLESNAVLLAAADHKEVDCKHDQHDDENPAHSYCVPIIPMRTFPVRKTLNQRLASALFRKNPHLRCCKGLARGPVARTTRDAGNK